MRHEDAEHLEKKTRAQRKRKPILLENDSDLSSDDVYIPPEDAAKNVSDTDSDPDFNVGTPAKKTKKRIHMKEKTGDCNEDKQPRRNKKKGKLKFPKRIGRPPKNKKKKRTKLWVPVLKDYEKKIGFLGPYSIIGHWYIADSFTKDLVALFTAFDRLKSWRFSSFATCWRELNFSLVYRGRYNFKELLEFTEEICFWTKKFTNPTHPTKWRVGALYTLYGLYHKNPRRASFKIRSELEEYESLEELARSFSTSPENPDPAYIFYKLKADGVFYYVATADEMGHTFYSSERHQEVVNYELQFVLNENSINNAFPKEDLKIQMTLLNEYEKVKSQIWDGTDPRMSHMKPGALSQVETFLADLYSSEAPRQKILTEQQLSDIGKKRVAIREKAAAISTTDDFLIRKQLQSPRKTSVREEQSQERSTDSEGVDNNLTVSEDVHKVNKLRQIMEGMQAPRKGRKFHRKKTEEQVSEKNNDAGPPDVISGSEDTPLQNKHCSEANNESLSANANKGIKRKFHPEQEKEINSLHQNGHLDCLQKNKEVFTKKKAKKLSGAKAKEMSSKALTSELRAFRLTPSEKPQEQREKEVYSENIKQDNATTEVILVDTYNSETLKEEQHYINGTVINEEEYIENSRNIYHRNKRRRGSLNKSYVKRKVFMYKPKEYIGKSGSEGVVAESTTMMPIPQTSCKLPSIETHTSHTGMGVVHKPECSFILPNCLVRTTPNYSQEHLPQPSIHSSTKAMTSQEEKEGTQNSQHDYTPVKLYSKYRQHRKEDLNNSRDTQEEVEEVGVKVPNTESACDVVAVTIFAKLHEESLKSQKSTHVKEDTIVLYLTFHVGNVLILSTNILTARKDFDILYNDRNKSEGLKNILHSLLPPKYQNHNLSLEFLVDESVFGNMEILTSECPEQKSRLKQEQEDSEYDQHHPVGIVQDHCSDQKDTVPGSVHKEARKQEKPYSMENVSDRISHKVTSSSSPGREQFKLSSGPNTNTLENLICAEIFIKIPKKSKDSPITEETMLILDTTFLHESVLIHSVKFKITKGDLEGAHCDEKKIRMLKKMFRSLVPSNYKNYEMFLQIKNYDAVFGTSGTGVSSLHKDDCRATTGKSNTTQGQED